MKVLTIGTFDMLHQGHLNLLAACHKLAAGGEVIVGINCDAFVKTFKKVTPVQDEQTRAQVVASLKSVDQVRYNEDCGHSLIRRMRPDLLVVGSDWATKDYHAQIGMSKVALARQGVLLIYVPYTDGVSSTMLRERADEQRKDRSADANAGGSGTVRPRGSDDGADEDRQV